MTLRDKTESKIGELKSTM